MYTIILKNIELNLPIGIFDFEKVKKQRVTMQLELKSYSNFKFNSIDDCIDYSKITNYIFSFENKTHVELIENLQMDIINFCFDFHEDIYFVDLTIFKPDIIPNVECGVNMQFHKEDFLRLNK